MEAVQFTRNLALCDEVYSAIKTALLEDNFWGIHVAAKELLLKNQLLWTDIVRLLVEDRCIARLQLLIELSRLISNGRQGKLTALWILHKDTSFCRTAFNMVLALKDEDLLGMDGIKLTNPIWKPRLDSRCVNVDLMLDKLGESWAAQDWQLVLSWIRVAGAAILHPYSMSDEHRSMLIRQKVKGSLLQLIITCMLTNTTDRNMRLYLNAWYEISLCCTLTPAYQLMMLFAVAINCMEGVHNDQTPVDSVWRAPEWGAAATLEDIPDKAISIETFRGRTGKGCVLSEFSAIVHDFNPNFHGSRERSSPDIYIQTWFTKNKDALTDKAASNFKDLYHFKFSQTLDDTDKYPNENDELCELKLRDFHPDDPEYLDPEFEYHAHLTRFRSPASNFYDLRDTVERVLERAIHHFINHVLRHHPSVWVARSLRDVSICYSYFCVCFLSMNSAALNCFLSYIFRSIVGPIPSPSHATCTWLLRCGVMLALWLDTGGTLVCCTKQTTPSP